MLHTFILLPSIFFFVCLLIFFFLLSLSFFFSLFFFSLSQGHMKQKNGSRCTFRRLFRPESAISTCFSRIGMFRWSFRPYQFSFPPESARNGLVLAQIGANLAEFGQIKKKKKGGESRQVRCRTSRRAASNSGAATLELR